MTDMVPVINCTGCASCVFSCPRDAIVMGANQEGFLYPRVDAQKCNACGLCIENCPVQNLCSPENNDNPIVYAGWTNDSEVLRQSTSGGVFSEIARNVLDAGGVVFGAAYDDAMRVRHIAVLLWDDLKTLRGSKYVQSNVDDTYRQAEKYLAAGRRVLYTGTPCQVAGLYATIGMDHKWLLTCDLVCHGVPSPKVFRKAIKEIETRRKSRVADFIFREKSCGWLHPTVRVVLQNGTWFTETPRDNYFSHGFYKNLYLREACYKCPVKSNGPVADITLGDFWELLKYNPSIINHGGTSAILVNTARGCRAIEHCADRLSLSECPYEYMKNNPNLRKSAETPLERSHFFNDIDRLPFENLARKYMKPRNAVLRQLVRIRRLYRMWVTARHLERLPYRS